MLPSLGVNIDHIATLRQLRGTPYPDLLMAAQCALQAGAHQITVHLREDRRHIQDEDVKNLKVNLKAPLNLEMATSPEILKFACKIKPEWTCLVPEKRKELTTEGGLALKSGYKKIEKAISQLHKNKIKVSLFIEPSIKDILLAKKLGADAIEIHTGKYCLYTQKRPSRANARQYKNELERVQSAALQADELGLTVNAGHGLDYSNVRPFTEWRNSKNELLIKEYNIGHSIICRAALVGLERAVREMVSSLCAP